jgi:SAM-dependent methyltransferase
LIEHGGPTAQDPQTPSDQRLAAVRWDAEYRNGRYADDPPLPFVADILDTLDEHPALRDGVGLYIGCGNGRNYLPLVDAGLRVLGLDLSLEALRQLAARRPAALPLVCGDFLTVGVSGGLSYVVAIQVFQHGVAADVATYFANVAALLRPGGLFFLRVNAVATQIFQPHTVLERERRGGMTIRYDAGPKQDMAVHFYAREELSDLTHDAFDVVLPLREEIIHRAPPQTGFWAQWEGVWRRRLPTM